MPDSGREVVAGPAVLDAVREAARAAAPQEACGLLLGRHEAGRVVLDGWVPSPNIAADPVHRFEVDPAVRLRVQRETRDGGGDSVVGLYHSHPAGAPVPSATDRACLYEPGLVWLIAGRGPRWVIRAWLALEGDFRELPLTVADP